MLSMLSPRSSGLTAQTHLPTLQAGKRNEKNQIFSCLPPSEQPWEERKARLSEGGIRSLAERASVRLLGCLVWIRPLWSGILLINWLIGAAILACTGDT